MVHNFFLVEASENPRFDYTRYYDKVPSVTIHHDLIEYVHDSLLWLATYNPAQSMEKQTGLNLYGVTVLKSTGAKRLYEISTAWSHLFKQSPKNLRLTGRYSWKPGEPETGEYEQLVFDRDETVASFDVLADICLEVSESEGTAFILHHGI